MRIQADNWTAIDRGLYIRWVICSTLGLTICFSVSAAIAHALGVRLLDEDMTTTSHLISTMGGYLLLGIIQLPIWWNDRKIWRDWVVATMIAGLLLALIAELFGMVFRSAGFIFEVLLIGLALGSTQAYVLRHRMRWPVLWIIVNAIAWLLNTGFGAWVSAIIRDVWLTFVNSPVPMLLTTMIGLSGFYMMTGLALIVLYHHANKP